MPRGAHSIAEYPEPQPGITNVPADIRFLVDNPCDASPSVYMHSLSGALENALLALVMPQPHNVAKWYVRPKVPGRRYRWRDNREEKKVRGRDGKEHWRPREEEPEPPRRLRFRIPDPNQELAKIVPGKHWFESGRELRFGEKYLWRILGELEHAAWWWLMIDIVEDGLYDWAHSIWQQSCWISKPCVELSHDQAILRVDEQFTNTDSIFAQSGSAIVDVHNNIGFERRPTKLYSLTCFHGALIGPMDIWGEVKAEWHDWFLPNVAPMVMEIFGAAFHVSPFVPFTVVGPKNFEANGFIKCTFHLHIAVSNALDVGWKIRPVNTRHGWRFNWSGWYSVSGSATTYASPQQFEKNHWDNDIHWELGIL